MRRVLAARLDNDGDVLLTGPALRAVAAGADHLTLLCGPRGARAAGLLPGVDEVWTWRAPWIDPEPEPVDRVDVLGLERRLAGGGFDSVLVFTSFHQSPLPLALLLRMAGVPTVAAISEDYPGSLLDVRHRVAEDLHEVERALSLAATLGFVLPAGDDGHLAVLDDHEGPALPEPYVVVHPGTSVTARAWSAGRHAALVAALAERGRNPVVTGAPSERELTARVAGADGIDLGGETSLGELAAVLAGAAAVVVGNTGPAHLAAAVGAPVVSLFAPTVPWERWRPYGVACERLFVDVPCAGCRARECPVPGHPCLEGVGVEDVLGAIGRIVRVGAPA